MATDDFPLVYIPRNLNIDKLISEYLPDNISPFHRDNLLYILGLLSLIPSRNRKLRYDNGYVPLNSHLLHNNINNYRQYINYLIEHNVIESDHQYVRGEKSMGYRYTTKYMTELVPQPIRKYTIRKLLRKSNPQGYTYVPNNALLYLQRWWNHKLQIDYNQALAWLTKEYQANIDNGVRNAKWKFIHHKLSLDSFRDRQFYFYRDTTVGRLHTPLTNMKSELRNFITYDGKQLVSVDVRNSQPFLLGSLLNEHFYIPTLKSLLADSKNLAAFRKILQKSGHEKYRLTLIEEVILDSSHPLPMTLAALSVNTQIKNINSVENLSSIILYIMISKYEDSIAAAEFQKFIELSSQGKLYEYLAEEIKNRLGITFPSRKKLKEGLFLVLFTDNRFIGQKEAQPKRIFREIFPNVYNITSLIKKGDATALPRLLQGIEAQIILNNVCLRISHEKPTLPIYTIHDSIVCPVGDEDYVANIIKEETFLAIGLVPSLQYEFWTPEAI